MDNQVSNRSVSGAESASGQQAVGRNAVLEKAALVIEYEPSHRDFSVLDGLKRLLKPEDCEVYLVHVHSEVAENQSLDPNDSAASDARRMVLDALKKDGYTIKGEQLCGLKERQTEALLQTLEDKGMDLIISCGTFNGTHNKEGRFIRSQFANNLALYAKTPVLLIKQPLVRKTTPLNVLFGVDGSESSLLAARKLGSLIHPDQMALTLVIAQSPVFQEIALLTPYVNQQALDEALEVNANMVFEMVTDILDAQGIKVQARKRQSGSPASELGYLAELENPDLLVLGSHNKKGFLAWLTGSVTSQLVNWGAHNMLIVR